MSNFAEVEAEVSRIVEDHIESLISTATVKKHIARAQRAIEDRCAFDIQKASVTYQVVSATATYAKPDDYIAVRQAPRFLEQLTSQRPRKIAEIHDVEDFGVASETGVPRYWEDADEESFRFWPVGDDLGPSVVTSGAYDIVVPYFKRLTELSAAADTNWWSENMDDVLAWRAASFVFAEMRDPMANWWSSTAAARFLEIQRQYKRNKMRSRATQIFPTEVISGGTNSLRSIGRRTWIADSQA